MKKFWRDPKFVEWTPILCSLLLDGAAIGQILRMIQTQSSRDQSIPSWAMVTTALFLWHNFYMICTPDQKKAIWSCRVGCSINVILLAVAIYFRHL